LGLGAWVCFQSAFSVRPIVLQSRPPAGADHRPASPLGLVVARARRPGL